MSDDDIRPTEWDKPAPVLIIERDEQGHLVAAAGFLNGVPVALEHEGTATEMIDRLLELGFHALEVEQAIRTARRTFLQVGQLLDGDLETLELPPPE